MAKADRQGVKYVRTMEAAALFDRLKTTGDSLTSTIDGKNVFWSLTRAGTSVDRRLVASLFSDKCLIPFGGTLLDESPTCLILSPDVSAVVGEEPPKQENPPAAKPKKAKAKPKKRATNEEKSAGTECGAESRDACKGGAWCNDCAPPGIVEKARRGEVNWKGSPP